MARLVNVVPWGGAVLLLSSQAWAAWPAGQIEQALATPGRCLRYCARADEPATETVSTGSGTCVRSRECATSPRDGWLCPDLVYDTLTNPDGSTYNLKLDLYLPNLSGRPFPVAVLIHGGGWYTGNRKSDSDSSFAIQNLVLAGYGVASVSYRLSPISSGTDICGERTPPTAVFPAQIQDVKTAAQWLRANAGTTLSANRFGAFGGSAGGFLANLLGTSGSGSVTGLAGRGNPPVSASVKAVVAFSSASDFNVYVDPNLYTPEAALPTCTPGVKKGGGYTPGDPYNVAPKTSLYYAQALVGGPIPDKPDTVSQMDPMTWFDASDPAYLIVSGECDSVVPVQSGRSFSSRLGSAGGAVTYIEIVGPNTYHGSPGDYLKRSPGAYSGLQPGYDAPPGPKPTLLLDFFNCYLKGSPCPPPP